MVKYFTHNENFPTDPSVTLGIGSAIRNSSPQSRFAEEILGRLSHKFHVDVIRGGMTGTETKFIPQKEGNLDGDYQLSADKKYLRIGDFQLPILVYFLLTNNHWILNDNGIFVASYDFHQIIKVITTHYTDYNCRFSIIALQTAIATLESKSQFIINYDMLTQLYRNLTRKQHQLNDGNSGDIELSIYEFVELINYPVILAMLLECIPKRQLISHPYIRTLIQTQFKTLIEQDLAFSTYIYKPHQTIWFRTFDNQIRLLRPQINIFAYLIKFAFQEKSITLEQAQEYIAHKTQLLQQKFKLILDKSNFNYNSDRGDIFQDMVAATAELTQIYMQHFLKIQDPVEINESKNSYLNLLFYLTKLNKLYLPYDAYNILLEEISTIADPVLDAICQHAFDTNDLELLRALSKHYGIDCSKKLPSLCIHPLVEERGGPSEEPKGLAQEAKQEIQKLWITFEEDCPPYAHDGHYELMRSEDFTKNLVNQLKAFKKQIDTNRQAYANYHWSYNYRFTRWDKPEIRTIYLLPYLMARVSSLLTYSPACYSYEDTDKDGKENAKKVANALMEIIPELLPYFKIENAVTDFHNFGGNIRKIVDFFSEWVGVYPVLFPKFISFLLNTTGINFSGYSVEKRKHSTTTLGDSGEESKEQSSYKQMTEQQIDMLRWVCLGLLSTIKTKKWHETEEMQWHIEKNQLWRFALIRNIICEVPLVLYSLTPTNTLPLMDLLECEGEDYDTQRKRSRLADIFFEVMQVPSHPLHEYIDYFVHKQYDYLLQDILPRVATRISSVAQYNRWIWKNTPGSALAQLGQFGYISFLEDITNGPLEIQFNAPMISEIEFSLWNKDDNIFWLDILSHWKKNQQLNKVLQQAPDFWKNLRQALTKKNQEKIAVYEYEAARQLYITSLRFDIDSVALRIVLTKIPDFSWLVVRNYKAFYFECLKALVEYHPEQLWKEVNIIIEEAIEQNNKKSLKQYLDFLLTNLKLLEKSNISLQLFAQCILDIFTTIETKSPWPKLIASYKKSFEHLWIINNHSDEVVTATPGGDEERTYDYGVTPGEPFAEQVLVSENETPQGEVPQTIPPAPLAGEAPHGAMPSQPLSLSSHQANHTQAPEPSSPPVLSAEDNWAQFRQWSQEENNKVQTLSSKEAGVSPSSQQSTAEFLARFRQWNLEHNTENSSESANRKDTTSMQVASHFSAEPISPAKLPSISSNLQSLSPEDAARLAEAKRLEEECEKLNEAWRLKGLVDSYRAEQSSSSQDRSSTLPIEVISSSEGSGMLMRKKP